MRVSCSQLITMNTEQRIKELRKQYGLTTVSFFTSDLPGLPWRVFGSRRNAGGFQESVVSGGGNSIAEAIESMAERIAAGPINKPYVPILDAEPRSTETFADIGGTLTD